MIRAYATNYLAGNYELCIVNYALIIGTLFVVWIMCENILLT